MSFVIYRSSAGSGKTFTLVKEYLKIVLQQPGDFRHILAMTFTNKAAQEMKDRILLYVNELANLNPEDPAQGSHPMLLTLNRETALPVPAIIRGAKQVQELILHNFSDFAVTTIDSFMHRVIRTFAFDLFLPLDFEVELDEEILISQSVNNLIRKAGLQADLTHALVAFTLFRSTSEKGWNIERELQKIAKELFKESGQVYMDEFRKQGLDLKSLTAYYHKIGEIMAKFERSIQSPAGKAWELICAEGIDIASFFQSNKGIAAYFQNLADGNITKAPPNSYVQKTIAEDKWISGKPMPGDAAKILAIKEALISIYHQINDIYEKEFPIYLAFKLLERNMLPMSLLREIDAELQVIKTENKLLPIGEFNKRIADNVLNEPIPFIFERLGEKYKYYLLDEFQDTSVLQWLNLLPLVENALAGGHKCILVGDGKQAIYRFRNGEVAQFSRLPEVYLPIDKDIPEGRKLILARNYQEESLDMNYRTREAIVHFNNDFFSFLSSLLPDDYSLIYKDVAQKSRSDKSGGYVYLEFMEADTEELSLLDPDLKRVHEIIMQCLDDAYRFRDIAVLCKSNKEASLVSRHLIANGIQVSSAESVLLCNSPKVNTLVNCMQLLVHPDEQLCREAILSGVDVYGFNADAFFGGINTYQGIPLFELAEMLVRDLGFHHEPDPFIIFFLDSVLQFAQSKDVSLAGFLDWWAENSNKLSLKTPDDMNAVRVMTIHKSKGLEFNVVIYAYARQARRSTNKTAWARFQSPHLPGMKVALVPLVEECTGSSFEELHLQEKAKSELDFLNLVYVAMTRPRERLYVLIGKPSAKNLKPNSVSNLFALYLGSIGLEPMPGRVFEWGSKSKLTGPQPLEAPAFSLDRSNSSDWSERVTVRFAHPEDWDVMQPEKARSTGTLAHQLLAGVKDWNDLENLIEQSRVPGLDPDKQVIELGGLLAKVLQIPRLKEFFPAGNARNEAEILSPEGKAFRPDRVVFYADKTLLLDYKTGARRKQHATQLHQYADLLSRMGYPKVESWLLYLDAEPALEKVSA